MYEGVRTQVRTCLGMTQSFPLTVGLHQGSSLGLYIFDMNNDVLGQGIIAPAPWDMLYANDIVFIDITKERVQQKLERWRAALEDRGLKISRIKTEDMVFNGEEEIGDVTQSQYFKYLSSNVTSDETLDSEINHRIQSGWRNYKNISKVLYDKRISTLLKGKAYKTGETYGAETWPIKKSQERKLDVAEMRILRWMYRVTRYDKIQN